MLSNNYVLKGHLLITGKNVNFDQLQEKVNLLQTKILVPCLINIAQAYAKLKDHEQVVYYSSLIIKQQGWNIKALQLRIEANLELKNVKY